VDKGTRGNEGRGEKTVIIRGEQQRPPEKICLGVVFFSGPQKKRSKVAGSEEGKKFR